MPGSHPTTLYATLAHVVLPTPLGEMLAVASTDALVLLEYLDGREIESVTARAHTKSLPGYNPILAAITTQLADYFTGGSGAFNVPVNPPGTAFQHRVWRNLMQIRPSETRSYSQVAAAAGRPSSARAAAQAVGSNPIAIVIPCHRVIGKDGALTGYGGGMWRKEWLLRHERVLL